MFESRSVTPHQTTVPYLRQPDRGLTQTSRLSQKLSRAIGLSAAYRAIWARDLPQPDSFAGLTSRALTDRLDDESKALLKLACDLSHYVAESPLSPFLDLDMPAALAILPAETRRALAEFGYLRLSDAGDVITSMPDADETFSHFGLRYLPDVAQRYLANRDVVDAGSYDGASARFFLSQYPVNRVFCFEPDPDNHALLDQNTRAEQTAERLTVSQTALSDRAGLARMTPAGVGSSRSKAELDGAPSVLVRTQTLDMFLTEQPDARIGLIKLDVEGDAVPALKGAVQTITTHQPILIVSFYHTPDEFTSTLPFLAETFPDYAFMVRKVTPHLFKENVIIGLPDAI